MSYLKEKMTDEQNNENAPFLIIYLLQILKYMHLYISGTRKCCWENKASNCDARKRKL